MKTNKLGIIGMGHVGKEVYANAMKSAVFGEICAIDDRPQRAYGIILDELHAQGLYSRRNIRAYVGDYKDLADADVIIIDATYVYPHGQIPEDRQELLDNNLPILDQIMTGICRYNQEAVLIWISNPVDTLVHLSISEFGYAREKCLGTGTMLDSQRLKYVLGRHYGVDPKAVSAYMLGEHGNTAFAVTSRASIQGIGFDELGDYFPGVEKLDAEDLTRKIVESANEVAGPRDGVTDSAVAQCAFDLATAVALDEHAVLPVSTYIEAGTLTGVDQDVTMGMLAVIGQNGREKLLPVSLNDWEQNMLEKSADSILENISKGKAYFAGRK